MTNETIFATSRRRNSASAAALRTELSSTDMLLVVREVRPTSHCRQTLIVTSDLRDAAAANRHDEYNCQTQSLTS